MADEPSEAHGSHQDETEEQEATQTAPEETEPDTFSKEYVQQLRAEAAEARTKAKRVETLEARLLEANIIQVATGVLADPWDLLLHAPRAELVDDGGLPDADKIKDAAQALVQRKPHLADRRPVGAVDQGARRETETVDLAGMLRERA